MKTRQEKLDILNKLTKGVKSTWTYKNVERPLKFKAFHSASRKMFDVFSFCKDFVKITDGKDYIAKYKRSDFEQILQYVGLNDKNGVEIYEHCYYKRYNYLYEVLYIDHLCGFKGAVVARLSDADQTVWIKEKSEDKFFDISIDDLTEIVGNKYEHPDLIVEK